MFKQLSSAKSQVTPFIKEEISVNSLIPTPKDSQYANQSQTTASKNSAGTTMTNLFYEGSREVPIIKRNYTYAASVCKSSGNNSYIRLPKLLTQQDPKTTAPRTASSIISPATTTTTTISNETRIVALPDILPPLRTTRSFSYSIPDSSEKIGGVNSLSPSLESSEMIPTSNEFNKAVDTPHSTTTAANLSPLTKTALLSTKGKISPLKGSKIRKKWINEGERYNEFGQLVGKSGKPLRDTKRASQNRSAQKAFRVRREKYIKGLEVKSLMYDKLVEENLRLQTVIEDLRKNKGHPT